jgi:hypothetical protein
VRERAVLEARVWLGGLRVSLHLALESAVAMMPRADALAAVESAAAAGAGVVGVAEQRQTAALHLTHAEAVLEPEQGRVSERERELVPARVLVPVRAPAAAGRCVALALAP